MENTVGCVGAVILAAGEGSRMNSPVTKQKMNISGISVIKRCVTPFFLSELIGEIVVVCREGELEFIKNELSELSGKPISFVIGGKTRAESAKIGFEALSSTSKFVAIHDGARCLVTVDIINAVSGAAIKYGAATASSPVTDTVKLAADGFISSTVDRASLCAVQTPQAFSCELYKKALREHGDLSVTDDNMLIEALGERVRLVDTGKNNIKITTAEDIAFAEFLISGGNYGV